MSKICATYSSIYQAIACYPLILPLSQEIFVALRNFGTSHSQFKSYQSCVESGNLTLKDTFRKPTQTSERRNYAEMKLQSPSAAPGSPDSRISLRTHIITGIAIVLLFIIIYIIMKQTGLLAFIMDGDRLSSYVERIGIYGPMMIIGLMAGAIVLNPIPSAPIALAAGLAYGHTLGTIYVVAGALAGALIAFSIGRLVGHEILFRWFGDRLKVGLLGSQNTLTGIVFISRLIPFISFDIVSYAAGLTEIKVWRFTLATFAGIIPASFLLTHFGSAMGAANAKRVATSVLALGFLTLTPILIKIVYDKVRKNK